MPSRRRLLALFCLMALALCRPDAGNAQQAQESFPMGGLLRGEAATQEVPRQQSGLQLERPTKGSSLAEPAALFPRVMGPIPPQDPPSGLVSLSAQNCGACHLKVHEQWQGSTHAGAWTNPVYQAALEAAGRPNACIHCHIPLAEQQQERIVGFYESDPTRPKLEPNPRFQPGLQEEGVTCAACHVRDGVVYGTRTLPAGRSPHPVQAHPDLRRPTMCGSCHQLAIPGAQEHPFYDTLGEWARSSWGAKGVTCQDCHMPYEMAGATRPQGSPTPRRSHALPGGRDDETVRRALTVLLEPDRGVYEPGQTVNLTVRVLNTGAGHAVPTTAPFRRIVMRAGALDASGALTAPTEAALERVMSPMPPFVELSDKRLQPDSETSFVAQIPVPKGAAPGPLLLGVELVYERLPEETARAHGIDPATLQRVVLKRTAQVTVR